MKLSEVRKTVVYAAAMIVSLGTPILNQDLHWLPQGVANTIALVVAFAGMVVHYVAPNETVNPAVAATQSVRLVGSGPGRRTAVGDDRPSAA